MKSCFIEINNKDWWLTKSHVFSKTYYQSERKKLLLKNLTSIYKGKTIFRIRVLFTYTYIFESVI